MALAPPSQPVTGDSHRHLIARLIAHANALGYTSTFATSPRWPGRLV